MPEFEVGQRIRTVDVLFDDEPAEWEVGATGTIVSVFPTDLYANVAFDPPTVTTGHGNTDIVNFDEMEVIHD